MVGAGIEIGNNVESVVFVLADKAREAIVEAIGPESGRVKEKPPDIRGS